MSRIGEKKILIPDGVTVTNNDNIITVKGPKGQLEYNVQTEINVSIDSNLVTVNRQSDKKTVKQLHGTVRSLLDNMITGVSKGFEKKLEVRGVGYRAKIEGKNLTLNIGKSHDVKYTVPDDITVVVAENTKLTVSGISKQSVGSAAAKIRSFYPPEPYKGKGIRYENEYVRQKAGKTISA